MAFCPYCGARLAGIPATVAPSSSGLDEGNENSLRLATVLFGDVQGFTAMSEHLPPEEVTDIMNRCWKDLGERIVQYGGTIDKYVGDAIMARFGWPTAHEDDAVRAIHAALEMQQALKTFADELRTARGFEVAMRIGINSGQVMAGEVGSDHLKQVTLMGNTVNLASRLEHEADPGSVLVGENTYRLAKHAFEFEAKPPMQIRGQSELIHAFVPLRPISGTSATRTQRTGRRLKLVGRISEMDDLVANLQDALGGQGRLVSVVGDPGLGKSRLVEEFARRHAETGVGQVYASAPSFGESIPYSMLGSFVRSLLFQGRADREITAGELSARLASLLPVERVPDAIALFDDVLRIEGAQATEVENMGGRSRRAMLINVLKMLVAVRSQREPLLLILEDMQWADSASRDVLDQILTGIQGLRAMTILTYRPGFVHEWASMAFYRQITLSELSREHTMELLTDYFQSSEVAALVCDRVMEKAGGNPFFLEQLLTALQESGAIVQRDGSWVVSEDINDLSVPDTIQGILLARLDQLSRPARATLEIASVIGRIFARRLVQSVADTVRNLDEQLKQLQKQEFILERNLLLPDPEYVFKNSLTQHVVYYGLPEARRRVLHERVAEAIEELEREISPDLMSLLAVHYEKTANQEKAIEYAIRTGEQSRRRYANQDAIEHFRKALSLLEEGQGGQEGQKLTVLEALGDVYVLLSDFDQAQDYYSRAQNERSNPSDLARVRRKLGELAVSGGRYFEAMTYFRQGAAALEEGSDPAEQVHIWLAQARMDRSRGVLDSASATCLRALSLVGEVDDETSAALYFELGEIERERGHMTTASGYLQTAAGVWDEIGALEKQALVASALAEVSFARGELAEALKYFERALEIYQRMLDRQGIAASLAGISRVLMAMGDLGPAAERCDEAMAIADEIGDRLLSANCLLQLGSIHLERGELERAAASIGTAYTTFRELRTHWRGRAHAMVIRARLLRAQGDSDHARVTLQRAAALAREMDDPWLRAQVVVTLAELEEGIGRLDQAAEESQSGLGMARALSDPRLTARAERVLGRVQFRQGRRKEALIHLANCVQTLQRSGARIDAARAALDYVVALHGSPETAPKSTATMLDYALDVLEQMGSTRDQQIARSIAQRVGYEPTRAVRPP